MDIIAILPEGRDDIAASLNREGYKLVASRKWVILPAVPRSQREKGEEDSDIFLIPEILPENVQVRFGAYESTYNGRADVICTLHGRPLTPSFVVPMKYRTPGEIHARFAVADCVARVEVDLNRRYVLVVMYQLFRKGRIAGYKKGIVDYPFIKGKLPDLLDFTAAGKAAWEKAVCQDCTHIHFQA